MPTKYKIVSGFCLLVIMLIALALVGYQGLSTASTYFTEYDRLSRLNVVLSDMNTEIALARLRNQQAMANFSKESARLAHEHMAEVQKLIDKGFSYAQQAAVVESLTKGKAIALEYNRYIDEISTNNDAIMDLYNNSFQSAMQTLMASIETVTKGALNANNDAINIQMHDFWKAINRSTVFVGRYVQSHDAELNKEAENSLRQAEDVMKNQIFTRMTTEAGQRDKVIMGNALSAMQKSYLELVDKNKSTALLIEKSTALAGELNAIAAEINALIDAQSDEYGRETAEANTRSQFLMLAISIFGVIVGTAMAVFTTVSLIRTLGKMSRFAEAIGEGNFAYDPKIKERGEIRQMLTSLSGIPKVLENIVESSAMLSNKVVHGHLRSNISTSDYRGEFVKLADSLNNLSKAYLDILDALPISLMAADANRRIIFANRAKTAAAGNEELIGKFCGDMLGAEACKNSESCLGLKGMRNGESCKAETAINYADGRQINLDLQSMPLKDASGTAVGLLEISTDITQIRSQESLMRKVAVQASEISDRVAAASEELSAQVEEVSRSAEMQRDRVESTASAMTEMNSTVLEVARNAAQASEQSEETRSNADSGASLVHQVVQAINHVNAVAAQVQTNMEGLGEQAQNIGGVMNVISDIADQTNLLALNAAIEAARAGEAGRGFAVVADEVRKLAEKTMAATQEVGASIMAIQQSARTNIDEVRGVVDSVTQATGLANSSGESLEGILGLASATSAVVTSIATAAEEQSATSEEITRAISEINNIVNDTTEGMIQSSAAVQELSRMTQELNNVINALNSSGK